MSLSLHLQLAREGFRLSVDTALPGEGITAIFGKSGVGKTSLLRWIAGLEKHTGQLSFNGRCWQDQHTFVPPEQRQIGYVFQEARLFPHLSVEGNLRYAWQRRFDDAGPGLEELIDWLQLGPLLQQNATTLSGGQQQRVAIARALASSPKLLLMDEPLASLDQASRQHILPLLEQLQSHHKVPVLYVSHNLEEVSQLADELLLLEDGGVSAQGPLLELSHRLDLSINHDPDAASLVEGEVERHDEHYQLSEILIDDQRLYLPRVNSKPGDRLRVRIPARDVSLTTTPPQQSSILNILRCEIEAIENCAGPRRLIRLKLGQQYLIARLTHKSVDALSLARGKRFTHKLNLSPYSTNAYRATPRARHEHTNNQANR